MLYLEYNFCNLIVNNVALYTRLYGTLCMSVAQTASDTIINSTDFTYIASPWRYSKINVYHTENDHALMDRYR